MGMFKSSRIIPGRGELAGLSADWYWSTDTEHRFLKPDDELRRKLGDVAVASEGRPVCPETLVKGTVYEETRSSVRSGSSKMRSLTTRAGCRCIINAVSAAFA